MRPTSGGRLSIKMVNCKIKIFLQKHYKVHSDERGRAAQSMCKLCEKLNEGSIETKSYETLGKWWWGGGKCKNKVKQTNPHPELSI